MKLAISLLALCILSILLPCCGSGYTVEGDVFWSDPETGAKAGYSRGTDTPGAIYGRYRNPDGSAGVNGRIVLSDK